MDASIFLTASSSASSPHDVFGNNIAVQQQREVELVVGRGQPQGLLDAETKGAPQALVDQPSQGPQAARHRATRGPTLSSLELATHIESSGLQVPELALGFVVGDMENPHLL
jgi:hypothetical protein